MSEETGEIALSVLTSRLPASSQSDHEQTRRTWQTLKNSTDPDGMLRGDEDASRTSHKKRRISKSCVC